MRASDKVLLEAAYASWAVQDLDATLSCFAENVMFAIHLTEEVPFAGHVRGRDALAKVLQGIIDEFDFLEYKPIQITSQGIAFHSQVKFHYRHKATGLEYEGTMRHVWRIQGDQITRFEEFHDLTRVRAFFELLAQAKQATAPAKR
ncbi:MAG: nuclear transport factor 2 family protein [Bacteroidota bacterium]